MKYSDDSCSAADITPAVRQFMHIFKYLVPDLFSAANITVVNISWTECDGKCCNL